MKRQTKEENDDDDNEARKAKLKRLGNFFDCLPYFGKVWAD